MAYQWSVFRADLDPIKGHEQSGARPVLVVSAEPINEAYDLVIVLPITSRKGNRPARLGEVLLSAGTAGLPLDSFVLCYQARALDKRRLMSRYGELDNEELRTDISSVLLNCLDLPSPTPVLPDRDLES